jgi:hypothetical protein
MNFKIYGFNMNEQIRRSNSVKSGLALTVLLASLIGAVNVFGQAGGSAVPFLTISPDARSSGMGEVGTAVADDIFAVYWNPAGLGFHDWINPDADPEDLKPFRQISLAFSKWLPQFNADLYYSYGTFGQYFEDLDGTVALNITYMHLGEFTRTYENGQVAGKFLSNEFSIGASYGTIAAPDLGVGFQLKYIQSNLAPATTQTDVAGIGRSLAFDLGVLWKPMELDLFGLDAGDLFSLGFNLQNVGPKVTYRSESDPLPTTLRLGTAVNLVRDDYNDLKFALDVSKLLIKRDSLGSDPLPISLITAWQRPGMEFAAGLEYWYSQVFAIRAGYFSEPSSLGNRRFWNFGASVRYDIFRIDFSFINTIEENHPLANTMRFSLLIDWQ